MKTTILIFAIVTGLCFASCSPSIFNCPTYSKMDTLKHYTIASDSVYYAGVAKYEPQIITVSGREITHSHQKNNPVINDWSAPANRDNLLTVEYFDKDSNPVVRCTCNNKLYTVTFDLRPGGMIAFGNDVAFRIYSITNDFHVQDPTEL